MKNREAVSIIYHTDTLTSNNTVPVVRDSTGNMKQEKYRVTDLAAKIDFGKYIRPDYDWNFIVATDSSKPPAAVSFQAALDGYCDLQSSFKV